MGKMEREKGARGERALVRMLEAMGLPAKRRGGQQAANAADAPDVDVAGLWIECKVGARPNPGAALRQAEDAVTGALLEFDPDGAQRVPLAITRVDREDWVVTVRLHDLPELAAIVAHARRVRHAD